MINFQKITEFFSWKILFYSINNLLILTCQYLFMFFIYPNHCSDMGRYFVIFALISGSLFHPVFPKHIKYLMFPISTDIYTVLLFRMFQLFCIFVSLFMVYFNVLRIMIIYSKNI